MNEKVYLQVPDNSIRLEIKKTISIIQTYFIQRLRSLTITYINIEYQMGPTDKRIHQKVRFKMTFLAPLLHVTFCHVFYKLLHYGIDKLRNERYLFVY